MRFREHMVMMMVLGLVAALLAVDTPPILGDNWSAESETIFSHEDREYSLVRVAVDSVLSPGYTTLSSGSDHSCGVRVDGSVVCWGRNDHGQVDALAGEFVSVAAGGAWSCGIRSDMTIRCWGYDSGGFYLNAPGGQFVGITAGAHHSCGLRTDRTIDCWGPDNNDLGLLSVPAGKFLSVSNGHHHSCAIRTDRSVVCWSVYEGINDAPSGSFVAVAAGDGWTCGLRTDQTITCWGVEDSINAMPEHPDAALPQYIDVAAGHAHLCAITVYQSVECWSQGGSKWNGPSGQYASISAGSGYSCGLRTDQSVVCWGADKYGQTNTPPEKFSLPMTPADTVQDQKSPAPVGEPLSASGTLSSGSDHSCGVRVDGSVVCWGRNDHGQVDAPAGEFVSVAAGGAWSCGIRSDMTIRCWGYDSGGFYLNAPGGQFVGITAGAHHSCGLRTDRTIDCWGPDNNDLGLLSVPAGKFLSVSNGHHHSCAIRTDRSVVCWSVYEGINDAPSGSFVAVAAGDGWTCGLRTDQTITCWGVEDSINAMPEHPDAALPQYIDVAAGHAHLCAITVYQSVECWSQGGSKWNGPSGQYASISAGSGYSCGLRTDQSVVCWGANDRNQTDVPSGKFVVPGSVVGSGGVPGVPLGVVVGLRSVGGEERVVVSWGPPSSDGGSVVTGYVVEWAWAGSDWGAGEERSVSASVRSDSLRSESGLSYTVSVAAKNANGVGESVSGSVTVGEKVGVPGVPTGVKVRETVVGGKKRVVVSWEPPSSDGGSVVSGYVVKYSRPDGQSRSGTKDWTQNRSDKTREASLGVGSGRTYTVSVAARNKNGVGEAVVKKVTVSGKGETPVGSVPGVPSGVKAEVKIVDGKRKLVASWGPPVEDGGSAVSGYVVTFSRPDSKLGTKVWRYQKSAKTMSTGLGNPKSGVTYTVSVAARNKNGVGELVVKKVTVSGKGETPVGGVPGVPSGVKAEVKIVDGEEKLVASWGPPVEDGGSAVSGYVVTFSRPDSKLGTKVWRYQKSAKTMSTGLGNPKSGVTYTVSVAARNKNGVGELVVKKVTVSGKGETPVGGVPGVPSGVKAEVKIVDGEEKLVASWGPPVEDGGSAVSGYVVTFSRPDSKLGTKVWRYQKSAKTRSSGFGNPKSGVTYTVSVAAKNRNGVGKSEVIPFTVPWSCPTGNKFRLGEKWTSGIWPWRETFYRVVALQSFTAGNGSSVRKGAVGGSVQKVSNLSQEGCSWVFGKAVVRDEAEVSGNAVVYGSAKVEGFADVSGNARVYDSAVVKGPADVSGNARVYDSAVVEGWADVSGNAHVSQNSLIKGNAKVFGEARVYGKALVEGKAKVYGGARVLGHVKLSGDVVVTSFLDGFENVKSSAVIKDEMELVIGLYDGTSEHVRAVIETGRGMFNGLKRCHGTDNAGWIATAFVWTEVLGNETTRYKKYIDENTGYVEMHCDRLKVVDELRKTFTPKGWQIFVEYFVIFGGISKATSLIRFYNALGKIMTVYNTLNTSLTLMALASKLNSITNKDDKQLIQGLSNAATDFPCKEEQLLRLIKSATLDPNKKHCETP